VGNKSKIREKIEKMGVYVVRLLNDSSPILHLLLGNKFVRAVPCDSCN